MALDPLIQRPNAKRPPTPIAEPSQMRFDGFVTTANSDHPPLNAKILRISENGQRLFKPNFQTNIVYHIRPDLFGPDRFKSDRFKPDRLET